MGFRFFRRVKLAPGVTLNLSKSGGSLSFGPRGVKFTIGPRGQRATVGIPGTGIFYTTTLGKGRARKGPEKERTAPTPTVRQADRLTLGFFKRLITPDDHEALIDGWRELTLGNEKVALAYLRNAAHLADGAFLAGALALKLGKLTQAAEYLQTAAQKASELGRFFARYSVTATISIEITEEVSAHIGPDIRGVLLALAETYQAQGRRAEAITCLERLRQLEPEDMIVKLSLAELLCDSQPGNRDAAEKILQLAAGVVNESPVHTGLLLYKARALRACGLRDAALEVLTQLLTRKKGRPDELLRAIRYERALLYEELGQGRRARAELEQLYTAAPDYEDVAHRLGYNTLQRLSPTGCEDKEDK